MIKKDSVVKLLLTNGKIVILTALKANLLYIILLILVNLEVDCPKIVKQSSFYLLYMEIGEVIKHLI